VNCRTRAARLAAFNESFMLLAALCALALVAAWRMRDTPAAKTGDSES
jgi:hypothetical protein